MIISDNGISKVWREGLWVYKQQPKFLTDNEIWCLQTLYPSGYVPFAEQVEMEVIRLEYIQTNPITDFSIVRKHLDRIINDLVYYGIRHGDLTDKNILIRGNHPFIIDWSESRLACDPRPDKRREGDVYWLQKTFDKLKDEYA